MEVAGDRYLGDERLWFAFFSLWFSCFVFFEFLFYEVCSIIFCGVFQGDFAASFFDGERVLFFWAVG
jgi:hypothetical protein